jgi:hypothetical protein
MGADTLEKVDHAALSTLDIARMASEDLKNAEEACAVVATAEVTKAGEAEEALERLKASVVDVGRAKADLRAKIEDARRERGETLADERPSTAIDKNLASLQAELDRAHDHERALLERQAAAERIFLVARWNSIRERTNALNECLAKAKGEAAELFGRYQVATATRDQLQRRSEYYLNAQELAYRRILDHKTKHPHLYPETT